MTGHLLGLPRKMNRVRSWILLFGLSRMRQHVNTALIRFSNNQPCRDHPPHAPAWIDRIPRYRGKSVFVLVIVSGVRKRRKGMRGRALD